MQAPDGLAAAGERDVDPFGCQACIERDSRQFITARFQRAAERFLGAIDLLAKCLARLRCHAAELSEQVGDAAFLAEQRSEEHTSELQSLIRISYAVFCLKKKKNNKIQ